VKKPFGEVEFWQVPRLIVLMMGRVECLQPEAVCIMPAKLCRASTV
jgi:hypothetical protein